ncbi:MAG: SCO family protein [Gammaproteobacteria bacterium]|nr:SCO family protein [Gammaproteobacteria bacterium]MDH4314798.1 SCO family protein [Gammaproteobacteria bacterium]MDH5213073.1 SCO family protein [Gammaproteobacteria bacterium]
MGSSRKIVAVTLAALALSVAAVLAFRSVDHTPRQFLYATVLPEPMVLPEFRLNDQDGQPLTRDSFRDRRTLLFFGFTHCPDICPATLQQLAVVRRKLALELPDEQDLPDILLISVDPERDTPQVLREYAGHFGDGVTAASGELGELTKLAAALGIYFEKGDVSGNGYNVNHSAAVLMINRAAEFQAVFSAPIDIDAMFADLMLLSE